MQKIEEMPQQGCPMVQLTQDSASSWGHLGTPPEGLCQPSFLRSPLISKASAPKTWAKGLLSGLIIRDSAPSSWDLFTTSLSWLIPPVCLYISRKSPLCDSLSPCLWSWNPLCSQGTCYWCLLQELRHCWVHGMRQAPFQACCMYVSVIPHESRRRQGLLE